MNNKLLVLIVLSGTFSLLTSCGNDPCMSKNQFLDSYDSFTQEINSSKESLKNKESRDEYYNRYQNLINNCYTRFKNELSLEERQTFWTRGLASYIKLHDDNMMALLNNDKDDPFNRYLQVEIEQVLRESGQSFEDQIGNIIQHQLPDLIDSFIGELSEFNDSLKEQMDK